MRIFNLIWGNNTSWRWTRDLSAWADQIAAGGIVRMEAAFADGSSYEWASDAASGGQVEIINYAAGKYLGVFKAPLQDLRGKSKIAKYDCRLETTGGARAPMFGGVINVKPGVTTTAADSTSTGVSGIPDTVLVEREVDPAPAVMPLSLTAAIDAAQSAQGAAEAAASAAQGDALAAHDDRLAADQSASNADGDAQAAHVDRLAADQAKADSEAARDLAQKWATQTTPEVVVGQGYGAKKYAQDAAASEANAAASKSGADAANAAAAGQAAGAANSKAATDAALLLAASYAALAQAASLSATVATNLSIIAAAQRAVALMTDGAASFIYDTRKDSDGGAWIDKINNSILTEALNTATRGATAKPPKMMLIVARNATANNSVIIYDLTDPTCPLWMGFNSTGGSMLLGGDTYPVNGITALNGRIYIAMGSSGGVFVADFISDSAWYHRTVFVTLFGTLSARNVAMSYVTTSVPGIASNTVNGIASTIAPNTQKNPNRFDLPNPTVSVSTPVGFSTIRDDGVVCNSVPGTFVGVCFDDRANLWGLADSSVYLIPPHVYRTSGWSYIHYQVANYSQLTLESLVKIAPCGPGMVAIAGTNGLARIKLDPNNPAQSLFNVKTTTYDSGWSVLGKTVLAIAESNVGLSANSPSLNWAANFSSYANLAALIAAYPGAVANVTGGASITLNAGVLSINSDPAIAQGASFSWPLATVVGQSYTLKFVRGGTNYAFRLGRTNGGVEYTASARSYDTPFTFTALSTTTWLVMYSANVIGSSVTFTDVTLTAVARDVCGAGNHLVPVGSNARAAVATGADTAVYSISTPASVYLESLPSPDGVNGPYDFGTADFEIEFFAFRPSVAADYAELLCYGVPGAAANGAQWQVFFDSQGAGFYGAPAGAFQQVGARAINANQLVKVNIFRRAGVLYVMQDGVFVVSKACTVSIGATGAVLRVGGGHAGNGGGGGNLPAGAGYGGVIITKGYAPSFDLIAFKHVDQKGRLVANAQSLITGESVQGVGWCADTETLGAANSTGGVNVFSRSVRVANDNSTLAINRVRNSALTGISVGAIAGGYIDSGGSLPISVGGGLSKSVTAVGNGWFDLRINGTANASGYFSIAPLPYTVATAANGQSWTAAMQLALVAGSWANVSSPAMILSEMSSGGSGLASSNTSLSGLNSTLALKTVSRTFNQASVATAYVDLEGTFANGAVIDFTIRMFQPFLAQVASFTAFSDGLSNSANGKAIAMAAGIRAQITGAGVDVRMPATDGLRAVANAPGWPKRAPYDPTFAHAGPFKTTNTTPLNAIVGCPVTEGKSFSFELTIAAVQRDTQVAAAEYRLQGKAIWPTGGTFRVDSGTPELIHRSNAGISVGSAAADTTNKLPYVPLTGLASTELVWSIRTRWFDDLLQMAA